MNEAVKEFWISVKDALPAVKERVLVVASTGGHTHVGTSTITSIRQDGKPKWCNYTTVTHWAPLPELPN